MIGVGALSLEEAWEAVHVPTLILLFAFMVVSAQLRMGGFYTWVTHKTGHLPLSPPKLLAALIAWRNRGAWELTFEEAATNGHPVLKDYFRAMGFPCGTGVFHAVAQGV